MARIEAPIYQEGEPLWKKSRAFKLGLGMAFVGVFFSLPVAAVGLGIAVGASYWWKGKGNK